MKAANIMRKPAVRSLLALCLLNLFFLTQIISLRSDLHHRFHSNAVVENESAGKLLTPGPFDLPDTDILMVPVLGWICPIEKYSSIFSSTISRTLSGRGPPLLAS